jgi:hypothetical protein
MAKKTRKSSKRFYLISLWGGVEVEIISRGLKTYEEVLTAARDKVNDPNYNDGQDNVFYLVTQDNKAPQVCSFTSDELEPETDDPAEADGFCNDCMVEHLDGVCPRKKSNGETKSTNQESSQSGT